MSFSATFYWMTLNEVSAPETDLFFCYDITRHNRLSVIAASVCLNRDYSSSSDEQLASYFDFLADCTWYETAITNLPQFAVEILRVSEAFENTPLLSEDQLRKFAVEKWHMTVLCNRCGRTYSRIDEPKPRTFECTPCKCHVVYYCSDDCRRKDWLGGQHRKWCGNVDAPCYHFLQGVIWAPLSPSVTYKHSDDMHQAIMKKIRCVQRVQEKKQRMLNKDNNNNQKSSSNNNSNSNIHINSDISNDSINDVMQSVPLQFFFSEKWAAHTFSQPLLNTNALVTDFIKAKANNPNGIYENKFLPFLVATAVARHRLHFNNESIIAKYNKIREEPWFETSVSLIPSSLLLELKNQLFRLSIINGQQTQKRSFDKYLRRSVLFAFYYNRICNGCGDIAVDTSYHNFKGCSKCFLVYYCSKACQVHDWKERNHKLYCGNQSAPLEHYRLQLRVSKDFKHKLPDLKRW